MEIKNKKIFITVDVEAEWLFFPNEQHKFNLKNLKSDVGLIEKTISEAESSISQKIPITWFIRCDDNIKKNFGKNSFLLDIFETFIDKRKALGDSFGIHPHLYTEKEFEIDVNPNSQCDQIERAVESWEAFFCDPPKISRIGECLMNNEIAKKISELGIRVDSTALPGRKINNDKFQFDWEITPHHKYRPSAHDYRSEIKNGEKKLRYLEVPFSMVPIKSKTDSKHYLRYLNLSYKSKYLMENIETLNFSEDIVAITHPHEISYKKTSHGLISYKAKTLKENIEFLNKKFKNSTFHGLDFYCE